MKLRIGFLGLAAGIVTFGLLVAGSSAGSFTATFDGAPITPLPLGNTLANWDIQVHSRNPETWFQLEETNAGHGEDCSAPPATHVNSSYEGAVFQCRNHVMTAINASAYGVIYLTPNQVFDFSSGGSLTFEMSTQRDSTRDWIDVLITPWEQNLALPLLSDLSQGVDLQGYAPNMLHVANDNGEGAPRLKVVQNGVLSCPGECGTTPLDEGIPDTVNQAATRQTFKLTIAGGRIKFERLASATAPALLYWDNPVSLNFSSGVVQFGHHSYTPTKDGAGIPGTWHWDNFSFSSATPFTIIKADRRYTTGGRVNFQQPAPTGSYLRFSAICRVSVDGVLVQRAPSVGDSYHPEHMSSYFVPIAAGKSAFDIAFSADEWYTGPCIAKDFSIWSRGGAPGPTNTATQTTVATSTPVLPTTTPPTASARLSGRIALEGRTNGAGVQVSTVPGGATTVTAADGTFQLNGLQPGITYTITATLPGFLDARAIAEASVGGTAPGATTLRAGDINRDGAVTVSDVSLVAGTYGSPALPGSPADLTGNGSIDITDVALVAGNYGLAGPTAW